MKKAAVSVRRRAHPRDLGVGIIGVGFMGQLHAQAMRKVHGVRLVVVADESRETALRVAKEYGVDACFTRAYLGSNRSTKPIISLTLAFAQRRMILSASGSVVAIGFSRRMCLPAEAAAATGATWASSFVAMMTQSTSLRRARSAEVKQASTPYSFATRRAVSLDSSATTTSRTP